jgi:spore coat protein U-like protein
MLLAMTIATPAQCETTKVFTVGATIENGCAIIADSAGAGWGRIALGTVTGLSGQAVTGSLLSSGATGIQMDCTPGMTVGVAADQGNQASGGIRRLVNATSSTNLVPYALFANGSTTPWTTQSIALSFPLGTTHQSLPVSAKVTLSSPTMGGSYSDTVRITVSW